MKTRVLFASLVAVLALALALPACTSKPSRVSAPSQHRGTPAEREQPVGEDQGGEGEEGEEADEETGPEDGYISERVTMDGIPVGALARAGAQAAAITQQTLLRDPAATRLKWKFIGPTNIGGRVLDIAVDPNAQDTIYAATASGGAWKSVDGGKTFKQSWPKSFVQSVRAIAGASDGTPYAGTGEAGPGGGSITYGGNGIYKSTDGAQTWKRAGNMPSPVVGRIVVDPTNPNVIFVAGTGDLFNSGGGRGVYRSI